MTVRIDVFSGEVRPIAGRHRCESETSRGRCSKTASSVVLFTWGAVAICAKHLREAGESKGGAP